MKEQLYTIPLNDAINAADECPFCFIERDVEQICLILYLVPAPPIWKAISVNRLTCLVSAERISKNV